jgi:cytochrome P450
MFVKCAQSIFTLNKMDALKMFGSLLPGIRQVVNAFGIPILRPKESKFLMDSVSQTVRHRIETKSRRNDLIDLMIDAMKGDLEVEEVKEQEEHEVNSKKKSLDESLIIATAVVILIAGYETTGTTMGFMFWLLATNPDVQEKVQAEIDEAYENTNTTDGIPDYNTIQHLEYLDMVIHETLRMFPPVGVSFRECTADYKLPCGAIIKKTTEIQGRDSPMFKNYS